MNVAGDEAVLVWPAQLLQVLNDGGQAVLDRLVIELRGIESQELPSAGFQVVIAAVIFGNPLRVGVPRLAIRFHVQFAASAGTAY